ncbi:hypothetical protein CR513_03665, partial [Mucuna pruriens]
MGLHFESCLFSFKPQIIATKAQLSQSFNPAKLDSFHIANKWNIVQEESSRAKTTKTGDLCISHSDKVEVMKNEFRNTVGENSLKGLYMIDALQRLNIDYHFQEEIEAFLQRQYENYNIIAGDNHNDIHDDCTSLQGYFVPAGHPSYSDTFYAKYHRQRDESL